MRLPGLEGVPDWFKRTPAGKAAIAEAEKTVADQRSVQARQLAAVHKRRETGARPLAQATDAAYDAVLAAMAELEKRRQEYRFAYSAQAGHSMECDREIGQLEGKLRATCDPAIDAFQRELRDLLERERREPYRVLEIAKNTWGGIKFDRFTDGESRRRRWEVVQRVIEECEQLRLSPRADVSEEITKLRASIPGLEEPVAPPDPEPVAAA